MHAFLTNLMEFQFYQYTPSTKKFQRRTEYCTPGVRWQFLESLFTSTSLVSCRGC